jgi:hypothetical protein
MVLLDEISEGVVVTGQDGFDTLGVAGPVYRPDPQDRCRRLL